MVKEEVSNDLSLDELKELVDDVVEWDKRSKSVEDVAFPIMGVVK